MLAAEDELRTRQTALAQAQSAQAAAERNLEEFNDAVSPAEAIGALYDGMRTALVARVDSNGGARDSPLGALLRTEKLYRRISKEGEGECENKVCTDGEESHGRTLCCRKGNAFILSLKLMRAAGSELVKQNLWFFGPAKVFHDGGVAVSYVLYDPDGGVASSGVHMRKADWRRAVLPKKNGAQSPGTVQDVQRLEQAVKDLEQELKDLKKKAEDGR